MGLVFYAFSHQDADHLFGNLWNLFFFGRAPFQQFGAKGLYLTFFSGGIVSALNISNKHFQLSSWLDSLFTNPFPDSWSLSSWYTSATKRFTRFVTPYFSQFISYKGASAGGEGTWI